MNFLETDCAARTNALAGSTLDAYLGVNRILLALMDGTYRTLVNASAACNTI